MDPRHRGAADAGKGARGHGAVILLGGRGITPAFGGLLALKKPAKLFRLARHVRTAPAWLGLELPVNGSLGTGRPGGGSIRVPSGAAGC